MTKQAPIIFGVVVGQIEIAVAAEALGDDQVVGLIAADGVLAVRGQCPGIEKDNGTDEYSDSCGQWRAPVA